MHLAVENLYIFELRAKLEVPGITTETAAQLHKELYDVLLGDKIKAAYIELGLDEWGLDEPDYRKILEDAYFIKRVLFVSVFYHELGLYYLAAVGVLLCFI
jgi:hypothetical protein